ncbi:hypothetical protein METBISCDRAFT_21623 [Metschnikowia bicuspidata]|uniref:Uncharacterized protein n=1 Tax=Metschnikowia bicuspidata TaxID=27322 RepID=A0A4P9ZGX1_9ASCO|nr:hypothetical protein METBISCDRAFT_21623 [Metschnikowia bicuspidata]
MFIPVTVALVTKVLALHEHFGMEFNNPIRFVATILTNQVSIDEDLTDALLSLIKVETVFSDELLSLLAAYKNIQELLSEQPFDTRSTHYLQPLMDRLFSVVKACLTTYHEAASETHEHDSAI